MKPAPDRRLQCPHCGMRTWMDDYRAFMLDHDRPDGRRCRKAHRQVEESSKCDHNPCTYGCRPL